MVGGRSDEEESPIDCFTEMAAMTKGYLSEIVEEGVREENSGALSAENHLEWGCVCE